MKDVIDEPPCAVGGALLGSPETSAGITLILTPLHKSFHELKLNSYTSTIHRVEPTDDKISNIQYLPDYVLSVNKCQETAKRL